MNSVLTVLFPQWQGAGEERDLYAGAIKMKAQIDQPYAEIPISQEKIDLEKGILGYRPILSQLKKAVAVLTEKQTNRIFTIGGDCGVEMAPVSWLNKQHNGDLAVVWLDSHGDLNTPDSSVSKTFHGMPLRALLGEGEPKILAECFSFLKLEQVILAGVRDLDAPEQRYIAEKQITCVRPPELSGPNHLVEKIKEKNRKYLYIHVDVDVLDPDIFPAVLCPAVGGISVECLCETLKVLKSGFNVVGASLTEYAPGRGESPEDINQLLKQMRDLCAV